MSYSAVFNYSLYKSEHSPFRHFVIYVCKEPIVVKMCALNGNEVFEYLLRTFMTDSLTKCRLFYRPLPRIEMMMIISIDYGDPYKLHDFYPATCYFIRSC